MDLLLIVQEREIFWVTGLQHLCCLGWMFQVVLVSPSEAQEYCMRSRPGRERTYQHSAGTDLDGKGPMFILYDSADSVFHHSLKEEHKGAMNAYSFSVDLMCDFFLRSQMEVTFENVTITFILEEWKFLNSSQNISTGKSSGITTQMSCQKSEWQLQTTRRNTQILRIWKISLLVRLERCWHSDIWGSELWETIQEGYSKDPSQCRELLIFSKQALDCGKYWLTFGCKNSSILAYKVYTLAVLTNKN